MSGERIDVSPEPTPAEAEAIRRALEALCLVEPEAAESEAGSGTVPERSA